jgi:hypothetical protein
MRNLTELVRETALEARAALVGFAPISRFENAPAEYNPKTIFPSMKTAIALAFPQARGTLKAVEDGGYWQSYNCDSYWYLNEVEGPRVLRKTNMFLEEHGYTGVPYIIHSIHTRDDRSETTPPSDPTEWSPYGLSELLQGSENWEKQRSFSPPNSALDRECSAFSRMPN